MISCPEWRRPLHAATRRPQQKKGVCDILKVESEREEDGRWLAEVTALPDVMTYGASRAEAVAKAETLALRVLADRVEHGDAVPELAALFTAA